MKELLKKYGLFNIIYYLNLSIIFACLFAAMFIKYLDRTNDVKIINIIIIVVYILTLIIKVIDIIFKKIIK